MADITERKPKAVLIEYKRFTGEKRLRFDVPVGLLIGFHEMKVTIDIRRVILPGAGL